MRRVSKRVLIVEDELDVAQLVAEVLDLEGFQSRITYGETALADALDFKPDLVLLDLMMPGMDGFEVARLLRGRQETSRVPIVVTTAMHDPALRAADIGTQYFLAKPFDIALLIDTVNQATA